MDLTQAQAPVNAIYDPAVQQIQSQIPAIQQLYSNLVQGLQAQNQTQYQNVVNSAAQRGVSGYGVNQGAQAALADSLAQQTAQLGAQQAQGVAGLQGQIGQANVARGQSVYDLANSLQRQQLEAQSNQQKIQDINRSAQLEQTKNQQDYNVSQARASAAQARAAAKAKEFDLLSVGQDQITRQLRLGLNGVKGKDGHVSPENLAKAYLTWQAAGLTPDSFWKNFQGLWNPKQGNYGDQFHYFVAGR